jgi:hypothetical protein
MDIHLYQPTKKLLIWFKQPKQCASANVRLHKLASTWREVLESLAVDDRAKYLKHIDVQRSLGTFLCIESDTLGFRIELKDKPASGRGILSTIS